MNEHIESLFSFYKNEKKELWKSDTFMAKIYENRTYQILNKEMDVIVFLFNKIWFLFFKWKATPERIETVMSWFEILIWRDELYTWISNYLSFRRTQINENVELVIKK